MRPPPWLLPVALAACTDHSLYALDPEPAVSFTQKFGSGAPRIVDILFVVDSSGSMREEQQGLSVAFPAFARALGDLEPLSWRLGVTTTDLGGFGYPLTGCWGDGDSGGLRPVNPAGDLWLWGEDGATNAPGGDIVRAFAATATVGTGGCAFEMPLQAARRAIANAGAFLRDDALLAVIVVSDEDDCSVADPSVLDPEDDTLGPATSMRCFVHGVTCDVAPADAFGVGPREGCHPGGHYLEDPTAFSRYLEIAAPSGRAVLAVLAGPQAPVAVGQNTIGQPELLPSCTSQFGQAAPAVRLAAAVGELGDNGLFASLCNGDFGPALTAIGERIGQVLDNHCLAELPGEELDCAVVADGVPVPRCGSVAAEAPGGCWRIVDDPSCPIGLSLEAPGYALELSCSK